jgi:UDP-3-O-[3-hydroxymyristoyl] glucosamine N-acyltransferase
VNVTVGELAEKIGAQVRGDHDRRVERCAPIDEADDASVAFLAHRRYTRFLRSTKAGAVIVSEDAAERSEHPCLLVAADPRSAFCEAIVFLHGHRTHPRTGVSPHAIVSPEATLGEDCAIHPLAVIEAGARLGARCVVYPHCYVGADAALGDDCVLFPGVVVYDGCAIGHRVTVHAGTVIGQDGFGYADGADDAHAKMPHIANVVIEDDVEIGACCAIDRGALRPTRIGRGTKMSNGVVIGHGARIGPNNLLVAQVGIAGSVETGERVAIGGQAGVANHVKIGARSQIAAKSGVITNVPPESKYAWFTAIPYDDAIRVGFEVIRLPSLVREVEEMRRRLEELERTAGGAGPGAGH